MKVYAEWGPPPFVSMAAFVGFKPKPKANADLLGPEDLANFLAAFPGGDQVAPPTE